MRGSFFRQVLAPLGLCLVVTAVASVGMAGVTLGSGSSSTDPSSLPIGDGKVTTSGPQRGYVYRQDALAAAAPRQRAADRADHRRIPD